jgi:osmotically-inducible protein OsmY
MKTLQLVSVAVGLAMVAACNRSVTDREVRETADEIRTAAATAGERLADSWLTTKVQAQFFADDDIKARYVDVTTRDGVVTLKGHVESDQVRQQALQIVRNTDGVKQVQDQLVVGGPTTTAFDPQASEPVATSGTTSTTPASATLEAVIDDERIVTSIQASYFLDSRVKARDIDVDSTNGVVTVRGQVGSDSERAQALILASMTNGVQRVEDGLRVDASLPQPQAETTGTSGLDAGPGAGNTDQESGDSSLEMQVRQQLSTDASLKGSQIEVSVKDGVVLIQGELPDPASKQRALTMLRGTEGVVQIVDRLRVVERR